MTVKSDIELARAAILLPIQDVGAKLGIPAEALVPYGHDKAKISADFINANDGSKDVFARIYDSNGSALTNEFKVNISYTTGEQWRSV